MIEFARNVLQLSGANSTEVDKDTPHPVVSTQLLINLVLFARNMGVGLCVNGCDVVGVGDAGVQPRSAGRHHEAGQATHRLHFEGLHH